MDEKKYYYLPEYYVDKFIDNGKSKEAVKTSNRIPQLDIPFIDLRINISKDYQARALGMKVFDTSLPQNFVDKCIKWTGIDPCPMCVTCYDESKTFGKVVGITREGIQLMKIYNHLIPLMKD
jgi:hypothetical protein